MATVMKYFAYEFVYVSNPLALAKEGINAIQN